MVLDIFALIVIALLIGVAIWLVVLLGKMPGKIAQQRGHPQVDSIIALSWIGLITMGASWFIALVWAYYKPATAGADLQEQIDELKHQLKQLQAREEKS